VRFDVVGLGHFPAFFISIAEFPSWTYICENLRPNQSYLELCFGFPISYELSAMS